MRNAGCVTAPLANIKVLFLPPNTPNTTCAAHKKLEKMFEDGKIANDANVSSVWHHDSEFQKFKLDVFRTAFNEIRNKHGCERKQFLFLFRF
jgi:hypothetical protein